MRYFSISVTALLAAAVLAGCAADGDDQNYRELDRDRPDRFDAPDSGVDHNTRADEAPLFRITDAGDQPSQPDGGVMLVTALQDEGQDEAKNGTKDDTPADTETPADQKVEKLGEPTGDAPDKAAGNEPPEAGTILDRRGWNRITVGPADGTTIHNPIYWRDCPIDDTEADVLGPETVEARLNAAMAKPNAANWNDTNALGGVVQPVKFAGDIVMLLWNVVQNQPLAEVTTPPQEK